MSDKDHLNLDEMQEQGIYKRSELKKKDDIRERRLNRPCLIPEIEKLIRMSFYEKTAQKFDSEEQREDELRKYREKYIGSVIEDSKQQQETVDEDFEPRFQVQRKLKMYDQSQLERDLMQ